MKAMWEKYRHLFLYAAFGVLTTAVNIVVYTFCYNKLEIPNTPSNVMAWIAAVAFAFVTNKLWVFDSKGLSPSVILPELWKFISCRLTTGLLDLAIMYVGVDVMQGPSTIIKVGSNVVVIILNYVFSKLVIFRKAR